MGRPVTLPRNGDWQGSDRYDRISGAWVPAEEWQRRQWAREDAAFARKANQGELCAPRIISDSIPDLQSQVTGKIHDSKSNLRREYKQHGMIEVGNETPRGRFWHGNKPRPDEARAKANEKALIEGFRRAEIPPV